jgi:xanthine dehydrogenase YagR molybdenum-binding subunit
MTIANSSPIKMVGLARNRVDGRDKVQGRARFTSDAAVENVAYAALVQSTISHGDITLADLLSAVAPALASQGVLHVMHPGNCPPIKELPSDLTDDLPLERRPPFSDLTVQHFGQHMALVVAETMEQAVYAASLIQPRYREMVPVVSPQEVVARFDAPSTDAGRVRGGFYYPDHFVKLEEEKLQERRGQYTPAADDVSLAGTYETPVMHHNPIELAATIALWEGDALTLHETTRWITGTRRAISCYLDLPEEKIRILAPFIGGSFGSKSFHWAHTVLTALAARVVGRPVKLVLDRAQMFTSNGHRPITVQQLALVTNPRGDIRSTQHHTLTHTSTVGQFTEPVGLSTRILYTSPHLAISHVVTRLNAPTPCFMRGPGEAPGLFALEVAMDDMAHQLKLDPVEFRLRNHADIDQAAGKPWTSKHLRECYREAAERFGWSRRTSPPRSMTRDGVQVGWGMSTATYPGRRMPAGCRVHLTDNGVFEFAAATHEIGNGVRTVMCQIAADTTGLPMEMISFQSGDSAFPDTPYSGASQTTATVGSAVYAAAEQLKQRLFAFVVADAVSPLFGESTAELEVVDGVIRHQSKRDQFESVRAVLGRAIARGDQERFRLVAQAGNASLEGFGCQSFGAHFCEVEVDEEIGRVSVTRWAGTYDCGRIINPKLARSQIIGGITFGLGMALLEATVYDARTRAPLNSNLGEYHVATHSDTPEFDITFTDYPDYQLDPMGARGVGELGTCGVPAAIANAIFHATGKRFRRVPITAEALMKPF